jgi:hypothetical protein
MRRTIDGDSENISLDLFRVQSPVCVFRRRFVQHESERQVSVSDEDEVQIGICTHLFHADNAWMAVETSVE